MRKMPQTAMFRGQKCIKMPYKLQFTVHGEDGKLWDENGVVVDETRICATSPASKANCR
jgi:hypothetical protein